MSRTKGSNALISITAGSFELAHTSEVIETGPIGHRRTKSVAKIYGTVSEGTSRRPQTQSGALAYRRLAGGGVEVVIVRKSRSKNWGIPKGKVKRTLSLAENAAKEAFEEAGVKGRVEERAAGTYRAFKRVQDRRIVIEVSVHLLKVTKTAKTWPEKAKREIRWCPAAEAANLLREPVLSALCLQLAAGT